MGGAEVPGQPGFWEYNCNPPPSIGFQFAGQNFIMDPQDFILQEQEGTCLGALVGTDTPDDHMEEPVFILGALFMKSFITVFDLGSPAVGFGRLKATNQQYGSFTVVPNDQRTALGTGPSAHLSPTFTGAPGLGETLP
jgi:hypothetical protein